MKATRAFFMAGLALVLASPALAHSELVSAEPAPGASVAGPVSVLTLKFSGTLAAGSDVELFAGAFQSIPGVTTAASENVLRARLADPIGVGTYTVQWLAIGADGHPTAGSYQFAVTDRPARPLWLWALLLAIPLVVAAATLAWRRKRRPPAGL